MCSCGFGAEKPTKSKVSKLYYPCSCNEHISWLYIWKKKFKKFKSHSEIAKRATALLIIDQKRLLFTANINKI